MDRLCLSQKNFMKNVFVFALLAAIFVSGCGGSSNSAPPAISVTVSPTTAQIIDQGQQKNFTASIANDTASRGVTWSVSGASCTGSACGTLTGSTSTAVTYNAPAAVSANLTVTVTATSLADTTKSASVGVTVTPPPSVSTSSLPAGTVAAAYSQTLQASGGAGALTWSLASGTLPNGLSLSTGGAISGTPTAPGTSTFTAQVADSGSPVVTATKQLSITVNPAPLLITTTSLPNGVTTKTYNAALQSSGGTGAVTWSVTVGSLPTGLVLNAATGVISGTPTTAGSTSFTVMATDSAVPTPQTKTQALSITVIPVLSITTTSLPDGTVQSAYSQTLQSSGGSGAVTWSITTGTLPAGLSLNANSGAITGTPTTPGTSNFTVKAVDSGSPQQTATQALSIKVSPAPLAVTTTSLPNGALNTAYSATLQSSGGTPPVMWTVTLGVLPGGLTLNSSTGAITGTPTATGTFNFTVTATDSGVPVQTASQALSIIVSVAPLVVTTTTLPSGTVSNSYNATLQATGGTPPVTWAVTVGALPAGLALNASTGAITGTPTTAATSNFTVQATDSATPAQVKNQPLSITVNSAVLPCGSGSESLLNGQYAIALRGFDASGPVGIGATFNADGAGRVATLVGIEDINSNSVAGVQPNLAINSASSSYSVGSDHRGCLTLATSAGTQTFRFALGAISSGVASNGHIIQFDSSASHTAGVLRKQTLAAFSTTAINGNFAFGASGPRLAGGKFAVTGVLSLNGGGGVSNTSVVDFNNNGNVDGGGTTYPASPISILSGTYTIASSGRGTLQLLPSGSTAVNMILYVVSSGEMLTLSSDPQATNSLFVGSAQQQSSGGFSNASLNAASILYTSGLGNSGSTPVSRVTAGIVTFPSSGNFSFSGWQNSGGSISPQSATGTYNVASTGRVTFAGGGGGAPILYLVSANKGFALFTDGSLTSPAVQSGFLEMQTGGPSFSTSSANGTYAFGTIQPEDLNVSDNAGVATFNGTGQVNATSDSNSAGSLSGGSPFSQTYSIDATGLGVIPASCTIVTNCQTIFFVISPTKAVVFDVQASATPTHPNLQVAEQ